MAGDRCTVSQMADVIMEGLEEYAQLAADDMKKAVNRGVFQEQVPAGPSAGVRPCAEKRRQDKGISTYCACGGKGCADSGTGSREGTEVMAGGESI